MVALQMEFACSGIAASTVLLGLVRETSGRVLIENARADDTPSRDITRASQTQGSASGAMVTRNLLSEALPSGPITGFAVTFGDENKSALTSSIFSPMIVTSNEVPAWPPMGI